MGCNSKFLTLHLTVSRNHVISFWQNYLSTNVCVICDRSWFILIFLGMGNPIRIIIFIQFKFMSCVILFKVLCAPADTRLECIIWSHDSLFFLSSGLFCLSSDKCLYDDISHFPSGSLHTMLGQYQCWAQAIFPEPICH